MYMTSLGILFKTQHVILFIIHLFETMIIYCIYFISACTLPQHSDAFVIHPFSGFHGCHGNNRCLTTSRGAVNNIWLVIPALNVPL